ncbi:feruloyl esterase B [Podospora aff. communis PSN243]|uniref:Carboxylic ester hydrolase n=1 Tax=Podospora aff. communis PSN243 TaxID=3040156 RepID=A0AAV9GNR1_9PEZI|nr:feruloyl esterase B [Podospora aff. communis PSN243]
MLLPTLLAQTLPSLTLASEIPPLTPRQRGLVCRSDTFSDLLPPTATIESIVPILNPNTTHAFESPLQNPAYPLPAPNLPPLCALTLNVTTSPSSFFRFGLFLPTTWNTRFLAVGNGGFAGGINWGDMAAGARYGFAVMSTDTGHNSTSGDLDWALGSPEKQRDFGWRAMDGAVKLAKELIFAYYSDPPRRSYYSGCSTGGRQGLKAVQVDEKAFDGLLVGAPAWWSTNLATWTTKVFTYNAPGGEGYLDSRAMGVLGREVVRQCDGVDGVADGIVSAGERCVFDFERVVCKGEEEGECLTTKQVETAKKVYGDYVVDGEFMFPGLSLGSEGLWSVLLGGTAPDPRGQEYVKMFVLGDAGWDWRTWNDSIATMAAEMDPGELTADRFDVAGYRERGGKILMYHGDADGMIPVKSSDYYYNQTAASMGGVEALQSWFRYFRVPGMGHCAGTRVNAPWYFAGGNQDGSLGAAAHSMAGLRDAQHDALLALVEWVEKGVPVESIIATTWNTPSSPASGVLRQRPLCPWPKTQVLTEGRDEKDPKGWTCV